MRLFRVVAVAFLLGALPVSAGAFGLISQAESSQAESAIMSSGSRADAIRRLRHVPSVGVVSLNVRNFPRLRGDGPDVSEFRIVAEKYSGGIQRLRAALRSNPVTAEALAERGISINRVVGVRIGSNGSLRLYVL